MNPFGKELRTRLQGTESVLFYEDDPHGYARDVAKVYEIVAHDKDGALDENASEAAQEKFSRLLALAPKMLELLDEFDRACRGPVGSEMRERCGIASMKLGAIHREINGVPGLLPVEMYTIVAGSEPRTRCSVSFSHPPHDFCDGNPDATPL